MSDIFGRFNQWLSARTPHERKLMLLGMIVVFVAILFTIAEWTWKEQTRLQRRLPEARQQLAHMQEDVNELQRLKRSAAAASVALTTLAQSTEAAARSRGIDISVQTTPDTLEVSGSGSFQMVTDWFASLQADHNLRARSLTMNDEGGTVSFSASLIPAVIP